MQSAPTEYLTGRFFERVRRRFELCGVRTDIDGGEWLILRCRGCGYELNYDWLKKTSDEPWDGHFGNRVKHRLATNHVHKKCRVDDLKFLKTENRQLQTQIDNLRKAVVPSSFSSTSGQTIQNNIVIVNLPAVTRIGTTGEPLLCSDIPYPDTKTVKSLLANPEGAVPGFVIHRYFNTVSPSISAPDPTNKRLRLVQRDKNGNRWVDAPLDRTVDNLVYTTLDSLDDEFEAMKDDNFKDWKRREGLTATTGFDRTDAYQKLQNDVVDVLKTHGAPYGQS